MKSFNTCIRVFLSIFLIAGSLPGYAQVSLTATSGTATGTFTTLKGAFDAINLGTHKGVITIKITANTTESAMASLTASATDPASAPYYTSINIYPTGTRTITGNLATPLINLNGADNVTIDGRANASGTTKSLTITNTSTSSTAGTSTIRFINDASNNTVKYCTLKGSSTDASAGILFFSSGTTTGNDNNTIDNNNITCHTDASRPLNAVYAFGATANNEGNTISNNNIYNFLSKATASNGINISSYNSAFTISGNSFYETASFTATASVGYTVIGISAATGSGSGFTISGNFIGGNAALAAGTAWTKATGQNNAFTAISVATATGTANSIQGNTIKNISWTNSAGTGSVTNVDFTSISVSGASIANIGTVTGNTIGAPTGTASISFTSAETSLAEFLGIYIASSTVDCRNNLVGAITTSNASTNGTTIYGIRIVHTAGSCTIIGNTIGSTTTANSINAISTSTAESQVVYGISNQRTDAVTISNNTIANLRNGSTNTGTSSGSIRGIFSNAGTNTISGNTVRNLSIANGTTSTNGVASVTGIALQNTGATAAQTISGNTVSDLSNSNTSFAGSVIGIYYNGPTVASTVSRNYIHSLSVSSSSTAANLYGIKIDGGAATYSNNIVSLGGATKTTVYGIYQTGATSSENNNLYFNTVYISSSSSLALGSTNLSYALYSTGTSNTRDFRNNILVNARSTTSGSNLHYALYIAASGGTITCNNNNYFVSGTGGVLGYFGANKTALVIVTSQDASSISTNPAFTTPGTTAASYTPTVTGTAATGTGITVDYTGATRSSATVMGALAVAATVTTTASSSVTAAAATTGGNVTAEGGVEVTARGVVWSTATTPTVALSTKTSDGTGSGSFTSSITGLQGSTTYYVRAYATNGAGTSYGSQISFTTPAPSAPILTTTASSGLTATTVTTGGNISSDGGRTITQRGVVFGTTTTPTVTLNTKTFEFDPATGAFTSQLYGLTPGTTYYVRAYATNSLGTGYGNEISFTTPAQTAPAIAYSSPSVVLFMGTPANLPLSNTGGMPDKAQVSTFAGKIVTQGNQDGMGTQARFFNPQGITLDGSGNLYVADKNNHRIRKITPAGMVSTIAGSSSGYMDGNVTVAQFNQPNSIDVDASGDLYVFDQNNYRIRKISSAGEVTSLAGSGVAGTVDGTGTSAQFAGIEDLVMDGSGNLYLAARNKIIRKVTSSGVVTTMAGESSSAGIIDGTGTAAKFSDPKGISLDGNGNLHVSDNASIRKITSSAVVTTLAGSSTLGYGDGTGTAAKFQSTLYGNVADIHGNLYVVDAGNYRIRKVTPSGVVTTFAGSGMIGFNNGSILTAQLSGANRIAIDGSGNIFVSTDYHTISVISNYRVEPELPEGLLFDARTGAITGTPRTPQAARNYTVYAQNSAGPTSTVISITISGPPKIIPMSPSGVTKSEATLNVIVNANYGTTSALTIKYSTSQAEVDAGNGTSATLNAASVSGFANTSIIGTITGLTANTTYYYRTSATNAAGTTNSTTESFTTAPNPPVISYSGSPITLMRDQAMTALTPVVSGIIETMQVSAFVGNSLGGYQDGTGTNARFNSPGGLASDGSGNIYVADAGNRRIRMITPSGVVTTIAGSATSGSADGTGTTAQFNSPQDIAVDGSGNIYVADAGNHRIRKIVIATGEVTTLAGSTVGYTDGIAGAASFNTPRGIALDGSGNMYVADYNNHRIRKIVVATGEVTTLAGSGELGSTDGIGTAARFLQPTGIALDAAGDLYVAELSNNRIRKITPDGVVTTWAGNGQNLDADDIGVKASFRSPSNVSFGGSGNLYVPTQGNRIRKVTPAGVVSSLVGGGSFLEGHGREVSLQLPRGITSDASWNLYMTQFGHRIFRISNYSITPALPAGLSFNPVTGAITGIPTVLCPATTYYVTTGNTGGRATATFSLAVGAAIMTSDVTDIGTTTATVGGTVGAGYTNIVARGVVWGPDGSTPTVDMSTRTTDGTTTGTFTSSMTGLSPFTRYNVRSYVTFGSGTPTTEYGSLKAFLTNSIGPFANVTKTFGDPKFSLTAPRAVPSRGSFSYASSNTGVATVTGSEVTITGAGSTTITATQAAASVFATASTSMTLTVNKATPTITFTIPSTTPLKDANNLSIQATASNGEPVTIAIGSGTATGTLSGSPGSYTLGSVSSTGNLVFNATTLETSTHAAATRTVTMDVTKNNQTISFPAPTPVTYATGLTQTLSASTDASGLTVSFTVVSGPGNITGGNTLNITGPGLIVITASQAGDVNTNPAPEVTRTLTVNPGAPTVTSFTPTSATEGDEITITGQYFENVSAVTFGGTAATSFTVVNSTTITAVLGTGHTGAVSVTTTGGTGTKGGFRYKVTWTGATKTFNSTGNWSGGRIPQTDDDIIFSATAASDLELDGSKSVGHVDFNGSGRSINLGAHHLTVKGNLTMPGNITGTGKVIMGGSTAQTIIGGGSIPDLEISSSGGGVTIDGSGGEVNVTGRLRLTGGSLNANGKLRLSSTSSGTARVGVVTGTITGNVIAERYVQQNQNSGGTGRAWRLVSVPVQGSGNLRDFFMNGRAGQDLTLSASRNAETDNSGTPIVGHAYADAASATAAGFDWIGVANQVSSLRSYAPDAAGGSFASENVPNLSTTYAAADQGYMVFTRGDRKLIFPSPDNSSATTFRSTGTLKTGDQSVTIQPASTHKFTLVGNPYMSVLDLSLLYASNTTVIEPSFWIWDANIAGSNYQGAYVNLYKSGTQWVTNTGSYVNPERIESGMAFFVEPLTTLSSSGTLTISESHKSSDDAAGLSPLATDQSDDHGRLYVRMERADERGQRQIIDGVMADFHTSFKTTLGDQSDREKLRNGISRGALWLKTEEKILSSEGLPWPKETKRSIPLYMSGVGDQTLIVHVDPRGMRDRYVQAWLKDNVLKRQVEINMSTPTDYDFIGTGSAAWDSTRFEIVYVEAGRPSTGVTLEPDDAAEQPSVKLYPNPSKSADVKLSLRAMAPGTYSVHVLDMTGRLVATTSLQHRSVNGEYRILEGRLLSPGKYLIRLSQSGTPVKTLQLIHD